MRQGKILVIPELVRDSRLLMDQLGHLHFQRLVPSEVRLDLLRVSVGEILYHVPEAPTPEVLHAGIWKPWFDIAAYYSPGRGTDLISPDVDIFSELSSRLPEYDVLQAFLRFRTRSLCSPVGALLYPLWLPLCVSALPRCRVHGFNALVGSNVLNFQRLDAMRKFLLVR